MFFADKLTLDRPRRTADGYMAIHAKAARSGIYKYLGHEVDPTGQKFASDQIVNVYRPADEVFSKESLGSFVGKPITDDHPSQPVTSDNWRELARGTVMGAAKDGEYVGFDLAFLDAETIKAVDGGKRELSNGYSCDLTFEDGQTDDGTAYQAVQRNIRGNHVAVVGKGRAGSTCRIGDAASCAAILSDEVVNQLTDERTYSAQITDDKTSTPDGEAKMPHTLIIDGLQVPNVSDEAKAAIEKLQGQVTSATADKAAADTKVGELTATVSTKDGEIKALEQKLKDAEVSPAKLEQLAADRATLINQAKTLVPNLVTDGKTDAEIRKAVVDAKLGDAAKDLDDGAIAGAFKAFAKDAPGSDPVRDAITNGVRSTVSDNGASVRDLARATQF